MTDQNTTQVTRLTDLEVKEVSLVDHPANEEVFLIMKRLGATLRHLDKARWSAAFINDLPDSAFLYIEPDGEKDEDGRTTPRSLRHFPVRDADGAIDLPHLRNALARIPQSGLPASVKEEATREAQRLLEEETKEGSVSKSSAASHSNHQTRLEGHPMIRKDSPIVKAAKEAADKNEAEQAEETKKAEPTTKNAAEAAKMAEAAIALAEGLASKAEGLGDLDEFKALHAALNEMKDYFAEMASVEANASKADAGKADDEEEKSEEDEEKSAAKATKAAGEEEEKKEDEEEAKEAKKADDAPESAASSSDSSLSDIRNLLAELHSKLGPAADAETATKAEKEVAKGISALTERLDRVSERIESIETTRGVSRGEADVVTTVEKSSGNIFAGLI